MLNETFSAIFKHRVKRRICFLAKNTNLVMSLLVRKDVCLVPLSGWKRKKSKNDNFMNKRVFCAQLCQKWLWKRGYMCFRAFSMENDRGFRCHRWCYRVIIINLQHTQNLLLLLKSRLFHVMSVDVWVLPCNMIWIKIFIEQMRMGAKVLTCSTQRANISRWTWWVRSSMRFSTSFVTCQNKKDMLISKQILKLYITKWRI